MRASVIVRSKDEADRLRLTLASLAAQTERPEIVVVNDGSTDHTVSVIEQTDQRELVRVNHANAQGRSSAANAGAAVATGEVLIFLDGDTLAAPDLVAKHLALHRQTSGVVARGETFHLRCTRFFADPEVGTPMPGEGERVAKLSEAELQRMRVTREDVAKNFAAIEARAQPGIYPGAGPRLLYELEMRALRESAGCGALWAAASGSNQSVEANAFRSVGGFDPALTINEHRELALRLCNSGLKMIAAEGARTYHMTHRSGWRDPLIDSEWESIFFAAHPIPEVALLSVLWASLAEPSPIPKAARISTIAEMERAALACRGIKGADEIRQSHLHSASGKVLS